MALTNDKDKKISRQEKQTIRSGVRSRVKDLNALEEGPGKVFRKIKNYAIGVKSSRELIDNANKIKMFDTAKKSPSKPSLPAEPSSPYKTNTDTKKTKFKNGGIKNKKMGMGRIKKK